MKSSTLMLSFLATLSLAVPYAGAQVVQPDLTLQQPLTLTTDTPKLDLKHQFKPILQFAYDTAIADGHAYPYLLQAILIKESGAGESSVFHRNKAGPGHCFGIAQIKVSTVKGVLKRYPELYEKFNFKGKSDKDIQAKLINNDQFSVAVASKYLIMLHELGFTSSSSKAVAYNQGEGSARRTGSSSKYSRDVMKIAAHLEG